MTQELSYEQMKNLAELSAKTAASEVAERLREEIRNEFTHFERAISDKIDSQFRAHFGDMPASHHIIQHSQLDSFLKWSDDMKKTAWKNLISFAVRWGVTGAAVLYAMYIKFGGAAEVAATAAGAK